MLDDRGLPLFPRLPSEPGLYRFDFGLDEGGTRTYYIGESQNLARRARNYRNAKTDRSTQRTSRRIHTEITRHLMFGGSIDFAIATEVAVDCSGPADLRLKSARRLAENCSRPHRPTDAARASSQHRFGPRDTRRRGVIDVRGPERDG